MSSNLPRVLILLLAGFLALVASEPVHHPLSPLFAKTCLSCHGPEKQKGDFRVDQLAWPIASEPQAEVWRSVMERIEAGEMPPKKAAAQPTSEQRANAVGVIASALAKTATALAGRLSSDDVLRRLNREQYQNTVRDLLGINADVAGFLPEDATAHGFDRIGSALNLSGEQLSSYMAAADYALLDAMPPSPQRPESTVVVAGIKPTEGDSGKPRKDLRVLDEDKGTVAFRHAVELTGVKFPALATYRIRVAAAAYQAATDEVIHARLTCDGETIGFIEARAGAPQVTEFAVTLESGKGLRIEPLLDYPKRPWVHDYASYQGAGLLLSRVEVEGPILEQWPPRGMVTLFGDLPLKQRDGSGRQFSDKSPPDRTYRSTTVTARDPQVDAHRLMTAFLPQAFRRPVTPEEITAFAHVALTELARADKPTFQAAMNVAYTAVLCAPDFLFLKETPGKLDDYALASRLSYFLIGSMPDAELFAAAKSGRLRQPAGRVAEAERLLASPRAARFERDFVSQWLDLRNLEATSPDSKLYPEFDPSLLDAMRQETELFFHHVLANDLGVMSFIDSDWTFLNGRLAKHYGIPGVSGSVMRKVPLPAGCHRGGVITHASVLKVSANGTVTSPVLRGTWLLKHIIGRMPPPPPANIAGIEADVRGATTIREQLAKHRADTSCAGCHANIDPHGFALENFDVIGGWRTTYRVMSNDGKKVPGVEYRLGSTIESGDVLNDGRRFNIIDEYRTLLHSERGQIARAMVERLLIYAYGRGLTFADRPTIDAIMGATSAKHYGLRSLILEIVRSDRFATK